MYMFTIVLEDMLLAGENGACDFYASETCKLLSKLKTL